jgi:hypothetical protein
MPGAIEVRRFRVGRVVAMRARSTRLRRWTAAAFAAVSVACGSTGPSGPLEEAQARLSAARKTWRSQSVGSYSFVFARGCFCTPESREPVRIFVREHRVEAVTTVATGAPRNASEFSTIDGLFDVIQEAISDGAASVRADYDSRLGFPRLVYIDFDERLADEEYSIEARDLIPIG